MSITVKITTIHEGPNGVLYEDAELMARIELEKLSPVIDGVPQFDEFDALTAKIERVRTKTTKNVIHRFFTFAVGS